eukprot:jgi/Pico_ML_1/51272/g2331.t2
MFSNQDGLESSSSSVLELLHEVQDGLESSSSSVLELLHELQDGLESSSSSVLELLHELQDGLVSTSSSVLELLRELQDGLESSSSSVLELLHVLQDGLESSSSSVLELLHELQDGLESTSSSVLELLHEVQDGLESSSSSVLELLRELQDGLVSTSSSVLELLHELQDGLESSSSSVLELLHELQDGLESSSSSVLELLHELQDGLESTSSSVLELLRELQDGLESSSSSVLELLHELQDGLESSSSSVLELLHELQDGLESTSSSVLELLHEVQDGLESSSSSVLELLRELQDGLESSSSSVLELLHEVQDGLESSSSSVLELLHELQDGLESSSSSVLELLHEVQDGLESTSSSVLELLHELQDGLESSSSSVLELLHELQDGLESTSSSVLELLHVLQDGLESSSSSVLELLHEVQDGLESSSSSLPSRTILPSPSTWRSTRSSCVEGPAQRDNRTLVRGRDLGKSAAVWPLGGSVRELGYFYLTLRLGTPAKEFEVIVDTGSSMAYVACSSCGKNCGKHADDAFDPERSTSYQHVQRPVLLLQALRRRKQQQRGILVSDLMAFGDRAERVTFGCETKETGLIYQQEADGVMGMGRSEITLQKQLADSGAIEDVFSLCFGGTGGGGSVIFGRAELEKSLDMRYTQLVGNAYSSGFYKVEIVDMMLGGESLGLSKYQWNRGTGTIVDSGTTFVYLDGTAYSAFKAKVMAAAQRAGLPTISGPDPSYGDLCFGNVAGGEPALATYFPSWKVRFDDLELELPPINYLWVHGKARDAFCLGVFSNGNSGSLLGGLFARDVLVQYDHDKNRLGFARVKCDALPEGVVRGPDEEVPPAPQPSATPPASPPTSTPEGETSTDLHMLPVLFALGVGGLVAAVVALAVHRIRRRYRYSEIGWDEKTSEISNLTLDMERTLSGSTELQPFKATM